MTVVPTAPVPVATEIWLAPGHDDEVARSRRDLVLASWAAVLLERLKGVDEADVERVLV
jgi:hypothetical protein